MTGRVLALIGGQYGSEGKGTIAARLADRFDVHVRVGGPNAGHCFMGPERPSDGARTLGSPDRARLWKMRSLPCGWINPDAILVIGAGAIVDEDLLRAEIRETGTDPGRVFVDSRAVLIEPRDRDPSYILKEDIGATGEGVGPARMRRLARRSRDVRTVGQWYVKSALHGEYDYGPLFNVCDTVELLAQARERGDSILLEGTQGSGLSLIHGQWPYVTSHDTGAAQLCADAGVAPAGVETLLVVRTFPIRVGGNSGPMQREITWETVSSYVGRPVREFTTVTGRERRVAEWDARLVRKAMLLNRPSSIALTFLDYLFPQDEGCDQWDCLSEASRIWVQELQVQLGCFIQYVGTGGPLFSVIERDEP